MPLRKIQLRVLNHSVAVEISWPAASAKKSLGWQTEPPSLWGAGSLLQGCILNAHTLPWTGLALQYSFTLDLKCKRLCVVIVVVVLFFRIFWISKPEQWREIIYTVCRSELTVLRFKKKKKSACVFSNYWPIPVFPKLVLRSCVMSWTFCFDQERRAPPPVPKKPAKGPAPLIRERSLESSQRQEARKRLMAAKRAASVRQNSATESAESIEIYIPEAQTRLWAPQRTIPPPCPPRPPPSLSSVITTVLA